MNEPISEHDGPRPAAASPTTAPRRWRVNVPVWQAVLVGGIVSAVTVAITLTATHRTAVTQNAIAFVNGYLKGFQDGVVENLLEGYL